MNILLYLFQLSYDIIKAIINGYFYIFINIRKKFLDKYYKKHNITNTFSLIFKIIFLLINIFFIFHIYIFLYLIHGFFSQKRYFGIILRLVTTILVFHYLFQLFFSILYLFIWGMHYYFLFLLLMRH